MAKLKCPECDADVPATGIESTTGIGTSGSIAYQPMRQHTVCSGCGAKLVRNVEPPMDQWRVQSPS